MKKRKLIITALTLTSLISLSSINTFAHSGRTDANGGHRDNKNVSGLGYYHYHHGYEAHLHTNGCPYDSSIPAAGSNTASVQVDRSAQIEAEKQESYNSGYSNGYNDGYAGKSNSSSSYSSTYKSNFDSGYSEGYSSGLQALKAETDAVRESAKTNGYNDGYSGNNNSSDSYSGNHVSTYKSQYNTSYTEGLNKRNEEISNAESAGKALGLEDGYNKTTRENFEYNSRYMDNYKSSYAAGYSEGERKLQDEISQVSSSAYILGLKGLEFNKNEYTNPHVLEATLKVYNEGFDIYNNYLANAPLIGSSLSKFKTFAKNNSLIKISEKHSDNSGIISIDNSSKKRVTNLEFNIDKLKDGGFTKSEADAFIETFLTKKVFDAYTTKSSYKRSDDKNIYHVYNLKLSKKINKVNPKKLTISVVSNKDSNTISKIIISNAEPKSIKKLSKIK